MNTGVKAGFGKGTIHFPEILFPLEGFCGIHDEPHVRLMVLQFEKTAFALLEAELVIVPQSSIIAWREMIGTAFEIPAEQVVVQMTHAITTPHEPGPMGPPDRRLAPTQEDLRKRAVYHEVTDHAVAEAIEGAKNSLGEAGLGWGSGLCNVNVNCDVETPYGWWLGSNPEAYTNHKMTVLRVSDPNGAPKGLLVSFGMKPAAIDNAGKAGNQRLISSEVAGYFCNQMEERLGVPVIYAVSAGGNQIPQKTALRSFVADDGIVAEQDLGVSQGLAYAKEQADEMCGDCMKILDEIHRAEFVPTGWAGCSVQWTRRRGGPRKPIKEIVHVPDGTAELAAKLFRMGSAIFVMVRPELTAECEKMLAEQNPDRHIVLMTLANGEMKCLPDKSAFDRGTYEAQGSNWMPGAAEALIETITEEIRDSF